MNLGYTNRILVVDLSHRTCSTLQTENYREFLGGRGINIALLNEYVSRDTHPFAEESAIVLGSAPLVGTAVPAANRLSVEFKNAVTGGIGSANCGGCISAQLKFSGYDHVVIHGRSADPVYLFIDDGEVRFRDSSALWGKLTWDTHEAICDSEKAEDLSTLTIGPAGENMVISACLIGDKGRAAAYGGIGAIFGSKNLKAIAVRGTGTVGVYDENHLLSLVEELHSNKLSKSAAVKRYREGGTLFAYLLPGENRPHGVRNISDEFWSNDAIETVRRERFDSAYLKYRKGCFNCPAECSGIYEIDGLQCEGVQANTVRAFGSNLDVRSAETVLKANALANLYGLDVDNTSAMIAWAIECFQEGIIDKTTTGGMELAWGGDRAILQLLHDIAYRKGFGALLAEGVYHAAQRIGRGSEELGLLVKRTSLMEAAMRSHKGWALGIITSTRGGSHLRGASTLEAQKLSRDLARRYLKLDIDLSEPTSYKDKAALVVWQEQYKGAVDSLGLCANLTMFADASLYQPHEMAELLHAVTGRELSGEDLLYLGLRIQNIERYFNYQHAGFGRKDDQPPKKLWSQPVSAGPFKGEVLSQQAWNTMLDEYYETHRWDKETGVPSIARMRELGLERFIDTEAEAAPDSDSN